jgi:hypothetical protein
MKQSGLDYFNFHSKPIMFSITSRPGGYYKVLQFVTNYVPS